MDVHGRAGSLGLAERGASPVRRTDAHLHGPLLGPTQRRDEPSSASPRERQPRAERQSGTGDSASDSSDVLLPIIAALAIVAIGAGYLLTRNRGVPGQRRAEDDARRLGSRRSACRRRSSALARAGGRRRAHPEPDLHEPAAARGLPRRRRGDRRAVVHLRARPRRPRRAPGHDRAPGHLPPAWLRMRLLRVLGLVGWIWIVAQGIAGGTSAAEVATLFLWVYGWVGGRRDLGPRRADLALPRSVLDALRHRRVGRSAGSASRHGTSPTYPERLGRWPAVVGFLVVVWLELVLKAGPDVLFIVLVGYTALTLAMMAQYGRDTWRANAEVFTVWFRLLGRLAPYALIDEDGRVRRRPFFSGLLEPGWTLEDVVMSRSASARSCSTGSRRPRSCSRRSVCRACPSRP